MVVFTIPHTTYHQVAPDSISLQGHLTKPDGLPLDTTVGMVFTLYGGGSSFWTETHSSVVVDSTENNQRSPVSYPGQKRRRDWY